MMKKNGKQVLFLGGIFIVTFMIWTALIQMIDVQPLGQRGTNIAQTSSTHSINCWVNALLGPPVAPVIIAIFFIVSILLS